MLICFRVGGIEHCYYLPVPEWPPWRPWPGPPPPVNIPWLIQDATLVATLKQATLRVQDEKVRNALLTGVQNALSALQERAGENVRISEER